MLVRDSVLLPTWICTTVAARDDFGASKTFVGLSVLSLPGSLSSTQCLFHFLLSSYLQFRLTLFSVCSILYCLWHFPLLPSSHMLEQC
jgi:hypothetical protein